MSYFGHCSCFFLSITWTRCCKLKDNFRWLSDHGQHHKHFWSLAPPNIRLFSRVPKDKTAFKNEHELTNVTVKHVTVYSWQITKIVGQLMMAWDWDSWCLQLFTVVNQFEVQLVCFGHNRREDKNLKSGSWLSSFKTNELVHVVTELKWSFSCLLWNSLTFTPLVFPWGVSLHPGDKCGTKCRRPRACASSLNPAASRLLRMNASRQSQVAFSTKATEQPNKLNGVASVGLALAVKAK